MDFAYVVDVQKLGNLFLHAGTWEGKPLLPPDWVEWIALAKDLPKDGKVQIVAFKGFADGRSRRSSRPIPMTRQTAACSTCPKA